MWRFSVTGLGTPGTGGAGGGGTGATVLFRPQAATARYRQILAEVAGVDIVTVRLLVLEVAVSLLSVLSYQPASQTQPLLLAGGTVTTLHG